MLAFVIILGLVLVNVVIGVWVERKIAGFIQDRPGPNEVGPKGLFQTVADGIKLLLKEDIVPSSADKWLFLGAPVLIFCAVVAGFATLPVGADIVGSNASVGVFYAISILSLDVIGLMLAGWASNNKFSLLGSMRAVAQIISYEVPLGLLILAVVMISQTLSLQDITFQQGIFVEQVSQDKNFLFGITGIDVTEIGGFLTWNVLRYPLLIPALFMFFICSLAEANRAPFDIPEAESEIIAGHMTEYSGFRYSIMMLAEYTTMLLVAMLGVVLFLGGWNTPLPNLGESLPLANWTSGTVGEMSSALWGVFWFLAKTVCWLILQIWVRWVYPRLRADQLMTMCWKYMVPASLVIVLGAGVWRLLMI